jgi:hypothetical protein
MKDEPPSVEEKEREEMPKRSLTDSLALISRESASHRTPGAYSSYSAVQRKLETILRGELRQKYCYPGGGAKVREMIRCARTNCYRGGNGQNHESEDTERGSGEVTAAVSDRWAEA